MKEYRNAKKKLPKKTPQKIINTAKIKSPRIRKTRSNHNHNHHNNK